MTHIVRAIYEIMKQKKIIKPSKLSFVIIFLNMILLWTSWFLLCSFDKTIVYLPPIIHYFGIMLIITGIITFLIALFTIKTLETYEGSLITSGIYSRIRHPMYLGFLFWLIGLPIFYGGLYSFIISIPFIINVLFWRYLEEIELVNRFSEYESYKRKTFF
jgi:protein-S-isoprenylcysteine O-methyltransferase Ste14